MVYSGDTAFATSSSAPLTQAVNQDASSTTVTSSANPSVYGQPVTFTATVSAKAPGSGTPTGTVAFFDGTTPLGTETLDAGGVATCTTTAFQLGVGNGQSITAVYGGDGNFTASTSNTLKQTVNKDSTTTGVISSGNTSVYGQSVTSRPRWRPTRRAAGRRPARSLSKTARRRWARARSAMAAWPPTRRPLFS